MHVPYDIRIAPQLKRLGLYQVSQLTQIKSDPGLLSSLIERWRPETHTFHMPVGEMTVTLQDVSCLWGLPITGDPVTGVEYTDCNQLMSELLGLDNLNKRRKHKSGEHRPSSSAISLPTLRDRFQGLAEDATPAQVDQYCRAFVLDMFGCVMFPLAAGDTVLASLLTFLRDLDRPPKMNWGAAVLACLYRGLCLACQVGHRMLIGPTALLIHWSYTRFPIGRPRPRVVGWSPTWREPDEDSCPSYAAKWCSKHTFFNSPHGATPGVALWRSQWEQLTPQMVDWRPYMEEHDGRSFIHLLPSRCYEERRFWHARVPMIYFQV